MSSEDHGDRYPPTTNRSSGRDRAAQGDQDTSRDRDTTADPGPGWTPRGLGRGPAETEWATGVDRREDGSTMVYVVPRPHKSGVSFPGHLYRGDPPREVFQEVRGNHDWLYYARPAQHLEVETDNLLNQWVDQAGRQREAIESTGARHEWIVTHNPELIPELKKRFARARFPIEVLYVPMDQPVGPTGSTR